MFCVWLRGCLWVTSNAFGKDSILTKRKECYKIAITDITKDGGYMILSIDFNSDEAFYIQLRNQIIIGIATGRIREGDRSEERRVGKEC